MEVQHVILYFKLESLNNDVSMTTTTMMHPWQQRVCKLLKNYCFRKEYSISTIMLTYININHNATTRMQKSADLMF